MNRHRNMTKAGVTIWIDDVPVPAMYGIAHVRLWTIWRDTHPARHVGSTANPHAIKAMVKEAQA